MGRQNVSLSFHQLSKLHGKSLISIGKIINREKWLSLEYKSYNKMSNNILSILLSEKNFDSKMVVSTGSYILSELPCIVAYKNNDIVGLLTYKVYDEYIEIISLDSFVENKGIGSHLLNYAEIIASDMSKRSIRVITTNENIKALYFYQKNKYRITDVIFDAVTEARKIKPSIPAIDKNGIEIRDEIVLRKCL